MPGYILMQAWFVYNFILMTHSANLHEITKEKFKIFRSWFTMTNKCDVHLQVYMPVMKHDMHGSFFLNYSLFKFIYLRLVMLNRWTQWEGGGCFTISC